MHNKLRSEIFPEKCIHKSYQIEKWKKQLVASFHLRFMRAIKLSLAIIDVLFACAENPNPTIAFYIKEEVMPFLQIPICNLQFGYENRKLNY